MRTLIGILLAAALAFCGWWFVGAHLFRSGVEDWFTAQREEGRSAEVQGLEVEGFPLRFRIASGPVAIHDPESGWGWQVPEAEVTMPAWWPLRVAFALPERQVLDTPAGQVDLTVAGAGGRFRLSPSLAPVAAEANTGALTAAMDRGLLTATALRMQSDRTAPDAHDLTLEADGLGLETDMVTLTGGTLRAAAAVTLAEPVEDLPDAVAVPVDSILLRQTEMRFDQAALSVTGELLADGRGFAAGTLNLRLENWPAALEVATRAGLIPENRVRTLEGGLRLMAGGDTLELPLTLSGGEIRFGPLPLGPAPRLK